MLKKLTLRQLLVLMLALWFLTCGAWYHESGNLDTAIQLFIVFTGFLVFGFLHFTLSDKAERDKQKA